MGDLLYTIAKAILFRMDAERAHDLVLRVAAAASRSELLTSLARAWYGPPAQPVTAQRLFGLDFPAPIGIAAGLDKDGRAIDLWAALGFGFIEVGTVTPGAGQPGNDRPRLWRIPAQRALVNRMGFNNHGADALAKRLAARRCKIPVGANIGKARATPLERAADDYVAGLRTVWSSVDYVAINVSSPNTPGLRDLQAVAALGPLLQRVESENRALAEQAGGKRRPLLLKISPDLADADLDQVADLAVERGLDGLIATNTTLYPSGVNVTLPMQGGVSGAPLRPRALECTRRLAARLGGRLPIIGVGGIETGDDVYDRLAAGASLTQIYTSFVYRGPSLPALLTRELVARLGREGYATVRETIGCSSTPRNAS